MEKDVLISIKGMQEYEGVEPDVIELVTRGRLVHSGKRWTLTYQESELTGLEDTQTTIQMEGQQVTLLRVGSYNTQMVFEEARRHLSMYNTPYGTVTVGVNTRRLIADLNEQGGDIEVDYSIDVDHTVAGRNIFHIKVKEMAPQLWSEEVQPADADMDQPSRPERPVAYRTEQTDFRFFQP